MAGSAESLAKSAEAVGAVERTLRVLGVTDIHLLRRGTEIDRASEQLIIEAAVRAHALHQIDLAKSETLETASRRLNGDVSSSKKHTISRSGKPSVQHQALQAEL